VNDKLRSLVRQVPEDRLDESFGASFDTIRGTYAHILRGQMYYYTRWAQVDRPPNPAELPTIAEVDRMWDEWWARIMASIESMTPETISAAVPYARGGTTWPTPVWQLMLNIVNHSTHHRSELCEMLTRVGLAPSNVDYADFLAEQASHAQSGEE
jgi:uncharacterized damage-inducible protein DinB